MLHGKSMDRLISTWRGPAVAFGLGVALACLALVASAAAQPAASYPAMAPVGEYLMADRAAEIALARSAAPPSISADAEVLVLGPKGYLSAEPGKNGFVCIVSRSWFSGFNDAEFWNPKENGPICFNRQAARSVLPTFLARTTWVLAGVPRAEMLERTRAAMKAGKIAPPEVGSMTFMMGKGGYLGDAAGGPWHPHIMFYMPPMQTADWGANLPGTRVFATEADVDPYTTFYIPVAAWSDGTPDEKTGAKHQM